MSDGSLNSVGESAFIQKTVYFSGFQYYLLSSTYLKKLFI